MKTASCYVRVPTSAALLVAVFCGTAGAATLTVGPAQTYTTIQAAVDAAAAGDTINVQTGTYGENVAIATNNLTLKSVDGDGLAIINGDGVAAAVSIGSGLGVSIDGFAIDGNGQDGIASAGGAPTDPITIINNTIQDCANGFYAHFGYMEGTFTFTDNTISDCTIAGMDVYGFDGAIVLVSRNTLTDCYTGIGVDEISEGIETDATISENTIIGTAGFTGNAGIYSCCPETTTRYIDNTVTGDYAYGIYIEDVGCCGPSPAIIIISRNTFTTDNGYGIYFDELICCCPAEITITGNTLVGNDIGLYVASVYSSYVSGSIIDISYNDIYGNTTWGFLNDSGEDVPVDDNWWGDPSGPSGDGTGTGDAISTPFVPTTFLVDTAGTPVITEGATMLVTMSEDGVPTAFSLTLNAVDINLDPVAWSISSAASNGTASVDDGVGLSEIISYAPVADYSGSDSFDVHIDDGNDGTDTITVNVTINPVNDAPVITEGVVEIVTMSEDGAPTAFSLTLNATDADLDALAWSISSAASNGTAGVDDGVGLAEIISYAPDADYNGSDSFDVQVDDGNGGTDTIVVVVVITAAVSSGGDGGGCTPASVGPAALLMVMGLGFALARRRRLA